MKNTATNSRKVWHFLLRHSLKGLAWLLLPLFRKAVGRIAECERESEGSIVFIIGAPRTGSTALYQALTDYFNVSYIDNFAATLYKNLPLGMWLSKFFFGQKPHHNFEANFGNTEAFGWHAPSECGRFWYRWLPVEDHFVDHGACSASAIEEIRKEVFLAQAVTGNPLVLKNLNAGQRLRVLAEAFPRARFIFLRRDPRFTADSILRARHKNGVKRGHWWSIKPRNFRELLKLGEIDMVMAQVFYLERQIMEDLALFEPENVRVVHYNEMNSATVLSIGEWLGLTCRDEGRLPEFFRDSVERLSPQALEELDLAARKYQFPEEVFI